MSSSSRSDPAQPREAISIPLAAWDNIVQQLDRQSQRQSSKKNEAESLREKRTRYTKIISCVMRLKHDHGPAAIFKVTTRNFSDGGLGFFFNNFLHAGTSCHFALQDRHGVARILEGEVRWCRHVSSNLHECGVQFATPVDTRDFVEDEIAAKQSA